MQPNPIPFTIEKQRNAADAVRQLGLLHQYLAAHGQLWTAYLTKVREEAPRSGSAYSTKR